MDQDRPRPGLTRRRPRRPRLPAARRWRPVAALAAKAAVAAVVAWWVALAVLPGGSGDYAYYAPFGAVLATRSNVLGSVREAAQTVAAIVLGALVALASDALLGRSVGTIALVVGVGMLLASWRTLGSSRTWVPEAGLFVLVVGGATPGDYVLSYAGLTLLGAVIAVVLDLLVPAPPFVDLRRTDEGLREALAAELVDLASVLEPAEDEPGDGRGWERHRAAVSTHVERVRRATALTAETRRGNLRARRWRWAAQEQVRRASTLQRLAVQVENLGVTVTDGERSGSRTLPLDADACPAAAGALRHLADVVRAPRDASVVEGVRRDLASAHADLRHLVAALDSTDGSTSTPYQLTTLVVSLRRCLEILHEENIRTAEAQPGRSS